MKQLFEENLSFAVECCCHVIGPPLFQKLFCTEPALFDRQAALIVHLKGDLSDLLTLPLLSILVTVPLTNRRAISTDPSPLLSQKSCLHDHRILQDIRNILELRKNVEFGCIAFTWLQR